MNWLRNETDISDDWLVSKGAAAPIKETGFVDNWQTALGQFIDEDLSVSKFINEGQPRFERNKSIIDMRNKGMFPKEMVDSRASFNDLAKYAKINLGTDIRTDEDIENDVRDELKQRRDYANDVYSRASTGGQIGRLTGTFHAAMLDPLTWPGMTVGVGAAANASSAWRGIKTAAAINAGVAVVEEAAIQPIVYDWKQKIDSPYTVTDALGNIAMAAGGAATIGGLAEGLSRTLKSMKSINVPPEVKQAIEHLEREAKDAPDLDVNADKYFDDIEAQAGKINEAKPHGGNDTNPFDELTDEALDAEYKVFDALPEEEIADPLADIDIPTKYNYTVDGLQVSETKPLRQMMEELDASEEKLLTLKACLGG